MTLESPVRRKSADLLNDEDAMAFLSGRKRATKRDRRRAVELVGVGILARLYSIAYELDRVAEVGKEIAQLLRVPALAAAPISTPAKRKRTNVRRRRTRR